KTSINGPHQGALVDTPNGFWWFVHFQDAGIYGRVVHLNPVTWDSGWPLMGVAGEGGKREPVLTGRKPMAMSLIGPPETPATSDEFAGPELGPQWQWYANHSDDWLSLQARPGYLRLYSVPQHELDFARTPNLLLQKLPARSFVAETVVELGPDMGASKAGL